MHSVRITEKFDVERAIPLKFSLVVSAKIIIWWLKRTWSPDLVWLHGLILLSLIRKYIYNNKRASESSIYIYIYIYIFVRVLLTVWFHLAKYSDCNLCIKLYLCIFICIYIYIHIPNSHMMTFQLKTAWYQPALVCHNKFEGRLFWAYIYIFMFTCILIRTIDIYIYIFMCSKLCPSTESSLEAHTA
jgi:hypothetical protein